MNTLISKTAAKNGNFQSVISLVQIDGKNLNAILAIPQVLALL